MLINFTGMEDKREFLDLNLFQIRDLLRVSLWDGKKRYVLEFKNFFG